MRVAVWSVVAGRSVCVRSRACIRGLASTDRLTTPGSHFFEHGNHVLQLGLEAGSSDSLQVRTRCDWMPTSRHQRWMRVGEKPVAFAMDYRRARNAIARRAHAQRRRKYCEYLFRQYEVSLHHQAVDDTVRAPRASCAAGRRAASVGPGPVAPGSAAGGFTTGQGTRGRPPLNRETEGTIAGGNGA